MERVTEVTKDCIGAIVRVRQAEAAALPAPEMLHHRLRTEVDEVRRRAAVMGFSHQDAQDMAYALVALVDEVMLGKPEQYRDFWMSNLLQQQFFNENVAGNGFFSRLNVIRKDPQRAEVLQVYYLCLQLGFQGSYRIRGNDLELLTLTDAVQKELERARPLSSDVLSPHGERPSESRVLSRRLSPVLVFSLGAIGLALVTYLGLFISLDITTSHRLLEMSSHIDKLTSKKEKVSP